MRKILLTGELIIDAEFYLLTYIDNDLAIR